MAPDDTFTRVLADAVHLGARFYEQAFGTNATQDDDKLRVGLGGDIPFFPPFFAVGIIVLGIMLQLVLGRWRFMPWPANSFLVRIVLFGMLAAHFIQLKERCEIEMLRVGRTRLDFQPVHGLVTTGPYSYSRNPLYVAFSVVVAGTGVLMDSILLLAATALLPLYLDKLVIPAEEEFLARKFPGEFKSYAEKTPRWL
mmetsp:Transcript_9343/g.27221  ORF Transcript_9343/g.27221 Transcript_9343/m.27221 type:complete len:197 (-) Transcript_9343:241-831(-)